MNMFRAIFLLAFFYQSSEALLPKVVIENFGQLTSTALNGIKFSDCTFHVFGNVSEFTDTIPDSIVSLWSVYGLASREGIDFIRSKPYMASNTGQWYIGIETTRFLPIREPWITFAKGKCH